jgi:gluconokinase
MSSSGHLPALLFFFGLAGAGKTYVGQLVAQKFAYYFYDLDQDITPAMKQAIAEKRAFTDEIRDEYFQKISERISALQKEHPRLLVCQAAYKEKHRQWLKSRHPDLEFIWVQARPEVIVQRLVERGDAITPDYAEVLLKSFEKPSSGKMIENGMQTEEVLLSSFLRLFEISA